MTITDQIFNNNTYEDNKKISSSSQECLDDCIICSDSCIKSYSIYKNKEELVLILDIQYRSHSTETYRRKYLKHIKKGGNLDVF